jgi:hypothetical protein
MHLARRLGKSVEETARLTAMELSLWLQLDRPPTVKAPTSIRDFYAAVRKR